MTEAKIKPESVTKPIQLLAAWLVGLIAVDGAFLGAAVTIESPSWASGLLAVAVVFNVPLFLFCIFLLQTKFRPEMQEDSYYSKYLEASTGKATPVSGIEERMKSLRMELEASDRAATKVIAAVRHELQSLSHQVKDLVQVPVQDTQLTERIALLEDSIRLSQKRIESEEEKRDWGAVSVQVNDLLPSYKKIRSTLNIHSIRVSDTFGTTSSDPKIPEPRVIGFGSRVPIDLIRLLVSELEPLGIGYLDSVAEEYGAENVYIGSYAYKVRIPTRITEEIKKALVNPNITTKTFAELIERKRTQQDLPTDGEDAATEG